MALFLLNISVDTNTINYYAGSEFNEQESFIEVLLEDVLGIENAIKEFRTDDTQKIALKKGGKPIYTVPQPWMVTIPASAMGNRSNFGLDTERIHHGYRHALLDPPRI